MYKNIILSTVIFTTSLIARDNPFIPTKTYMEEKARILEIEQDYSDKPQDLEVKEIKTVDEESNIVKAVTDANETIQTKADVNETLEKIVIKGYIEEKEKIEKPQLAVQDVKKEITKQKKVEAPEKEVMSEVKKAKVFKTITKGEYQILPFVKLVLDDNKIEIYSDHKVFKKFNLDESNKIVLDYRAKTNFYTKRVKFEAQSFKGITIGNHKAKEFFRVVVLLDDKPKEFDVTHSDTKVVIKKK